MKPNHLFSLGLAIVAGFQLTAAAEQGERRIEEHGMVGGPAQATAASKAEPVTFLGVAVAPAGPALAAQLRLPDGQGLVVTVVEPDSPADRAGLKQHDVITKLDDQILIEPRQLSVLVRGHKEGDKVAITYVRAGAEARAAATLATHVPAAVPAFRWIGDGGPDVLFHSEEFNFPGAMPAPAPHPLPGGGGATRFTAPFPPGMPETRGAGERVMIFRPRAEVVVSDEAGEMFVRVSEKGRVLTARDPKGKLIFDGPIDTPEQRAALPEDLRARLEKFESRDVLEIAPPAPGEVNAAPLDRPSPRAAVM